MKDIKSTRIVYAAILVAILLISIPAAGPTSAQDYVPTPQPTPPITIIFPPGSTDDDTYTLVYTPLVSVDCPPPVGCLVLDPFDLSAYLGIDLVTPVIFDPPIRICMPFTTEQSELLGGEDNLAVAYWDPEKGQWVALDNLTVDTENMQVCGDLAELIDSECGIALTCAWSPTGVPVTGKTLPGRTRIAPVWIIIATAFIVIGSFTHIKRKSNSQHEQEK